MRALSGPAAVPAPALHLGAQRRAPARRLGGARVSAPLVLVDGDTIGRGRTGDEAYTVGLLRELPDAAPDLRFACSLRDPAAFPPGLPPGLELHPAAGRRAVPAHPVRLPAPGPQARRRPGARPLLRRPAPALPGRGDGARRLVRAPARAPDGARPPALHPLRARLAAAGPAGDRGVGVHPQRAAAAPTTSTRPGSSWCRTASARSSPRSPTRPRWSSGASACSRRSCCSSGRCSRARTRRC